jgi:hypothetical protein
MVYEELAFCFAEKALPLISQGKCRPQLRGTLNSRKFSERKLMDDLQDKLTNRS